MGFIGEIDDLKNLGTIEPLVFASPISASFAINSITNHWIGLVGRELCVKNPVWKSMNKMDRPADFPHPILGDIECSNFGRYKTI